MCLDFPGDLSWLDGLFELSLVPLGLSLVGVVIGFISRSENLLSFSRAAALLSAAIAIFCAGSIISERHFGGWASVRTDLLEVRDEAHAFRAQRGGRLTAADIAAFDALHPVRRLTSEPGCPDIEVAYSWHRDAPYASSDGGLVAYFEPFTMWCFDSN
jgi:hypothetical protein